MKRKILSLALAAVMTIGLAAVVGSSSADAQVIPENRRGVVWPNISSFTPGGTVSGHSITSDGFLNIDLTQEAVHVMRLPWFTAQPEHDMWVRGAKFMLFTPGNAHADALPVRIESIAINGEIKLDSMRFVGGGYFHNTGGSFFARDGNPAVVVPPPRGGTWANWGDRGGGDWVAPLPGWRVAQAEIPDIQNEVGGLGWPEGRAGRQEELGTIRNGDIMEVTIRVGQPPPVRHGHVLDNDYISADDVALLQRFVTAENRNAFREAHPYFNAANADVNGDRRINRHDVAMLSRFVANETEHIGPPQMLVALTFDDGPFGAYPGGESMIILNHMRNIGNANNSHVRATFFLNSENNNNNQGQGPTIVRRMVADGHELANHTASHPQLGGATAATLRQQKTSLNNTIRDWTQDAVNNHTGETFPNGVELRWFRPPFFSHNANLIGLDEEFNMPWAWANINPSDYSRPTGAAGARQIADFILEHAADRGADGGIILLHDGGISRTQTHMSLPLFIPQMLEMGYEFVTMTELFERTGATPAWYDGAPVNDRAIRPILPD